LADDEFVGLVVSHGQNMDEHAACGFSSTLQPAAIVGIGLGLVEFPDRWLVRLETLADPVRYRRETLL
jgi:hypothetical protein